tara:strand:+ start:288 stop:1103 length:816 start_codon:yes stop_codon:yes gene_type:complete
MKLKFWGVRGSIPTPGQEYTKYGGNTSCVEVEINNNLIILDMGSGLRKLGDSIVERNIYTFDILVSHFHYDHTCGLPFFKPAYDKKYDFTVNSGILKTRKNTLGVLRDQISKPSFPITIDQFNAQISYKDFEVGKDFEIRKNIKVSTISLNHPDGATGYKIEHDGKSLCYITDHEHIEGQKNELLVNFIKETDVFIYDTMFDDKNFSSYVGWGHSTWQEGARLAMDSGAKKLIMFHHSPDNNDKILDKMQFESQGLSSNFLVAKEGMFVHI